MPNVGAKRFWSTVWRSYKLGWLYPVRFSLMILLSAAIAALAGYPFVILHDFIELLGHAAGAINSAKDGVLTPEALAILKQASRDMRSLGTWVLPLAPVAATLAWLSWYMGQWLANRGMFVLRERFITHLVELDLAFHSKLAKGDLINRMSADMTTTQTMVRLLFSKFFQRNLEIIAVVVYLFIIDAQLALWLMPLLLVTTAVLSLLFKRTRRRSQAARQSLADNLVVVEQIAAGIRVIKAMGSSDHEVVRHDSANQRLFADNMKVVRSRALADSLMHGLVFVLISGIFILGGYLLGVGKGDISPATLVTFLAALGRLATLARTTQRAWGELYEHAPATERVYEIMDRPGGIVDRPDAVEAKDPVDAIRFEDVSFAYDPAAGEVLKHLELEIPVGKTVALVGESGAGKSTLLDLLPRFHDVTGGKITIDGTDIRDLTHESLVKLFGVVQQDSFLFNDTVYNNIAYGRPAASRGEVEAAARRAHVHETILQLEGGQGYETVVGDRGERLSGGQRQRVAIARALLRDAAVLLLDEPTSSLDAESERHVQEALDELMRDRTSVIVAHRLATVQRADVIHVLDKRTGNIVESGSHTELLERNGEYARLVRLQQLGD